MDGSHISLYEGCVYKRQHYHEYISLKNVKKMQNLNLYRRDPDIPFCVCLGQRSRRMDLEFIKKTGCTGMVVFLFFGFQFTTIKNIKAWSPLCGGDDDPDRASIL